MVELDTGNARYLIRFTQTLEQQAGWSWAMFNAVRKLSPERVLRVRRTALRPTSRRVTPCEFG